MTCHQLHRTLTVLIDRLDREFFGDLPLIEWGSPVPFFGDLPNSVVATLGLNPSSREFVDGSGAELAGTEQRLHTLQSLGITSWPEAEAKHLRQILSSCRSYFYHNSYDRWFKRLDGLIAGTGYSYYDPLCSACHLDLVPYATRARWGDLSHTHRRQLLSASASFMGTLLEYSPVRILVLNGRSVIEHFQQIARVHFTVQDMPAWSLPRSSGSPVAGLSFQATMRKIGPIELTHEVFVLGFNHNIQSSFGVTSQVIDAIREWISQETESYLDATA